MRRVMVAAAIASSTVVLYGGVALAGEIGVSPDSVPRPGTTDFDITLSEFEPDTPVFVLPCEIPQSGDADDIDGETCDIEMVTAGVTDADGEALLKLMWDVSTDGVAFVAGNEARTDAATALVTVQETRVLGDAQESAGVETTSQELPDTGSETPVLVMVAAALVAAGSATTAAGRRLAPV